MDGAPPSAPWSPAAAVASPREPHLSGPLAILAHVEQVAPASSGELVLAREGRTRGVVYVEHGRVCFAAARGLGSRLADLLRTRARIEVTARGMVELLRHGRDHDTPLGELLVESGMMTPDGLMGALRRHTAESLVHIGAVPVTAWWIPRERGGFQPRFTLSPVMLAPCVGALLAGREPAATLDPFARVQGAVAGGAFVRPASETVPIAAAGMASVEALRRLGAQVTEALDVAGRIEGGPRFAFTGDQQGRGVLAWRDGEVIVGALIDDRAQLARCIGPLLAR